MTNPMKITVIGAGSWGTAVAVHAAKSWPENSQVFLCPRTANQAQTLKSEGENARYLMGTTFPTHLQITDVWQSIFQQPLEANHLLVIATPFAGLQELIPQILDFGKFPQHWVWLCKGIDPARGQLAHEIIAQIFEHDPQSQGLQTGILSGPSFAAEVAKGLPCALTVASVHPELCAIVQKAFHFGNMRIYSTDDVIGVELGGAIKNILAIACGIADGLALGQNARAALITRGMAEMTRLGVAMGARAETFSGLTGLGDLILTATGDLSRNRRVGMALAQGKTLEEILSNLGHVAEGVRCAKAVNNLAQHYCVDMPIVQAVVRLLAKELTPNQAVSQIMARDPRGE